MNCKQGDLAVIVANSVRHPTSAGRLCDVLYRAHMPEVVLPDGMSTSVTWPDAWVIKLHSPIRVMRPKGTKWDELIYAVCTDSKLRPIRDQDGQDETLTWLDVPSKEIA